MAGTGTIPEERVFSAGGAGDRPQHEWHDAGWMETRGERFGATRPVSIYEVHLGSWMRVPEENNRVLTYREIASNLANYAGRMGYTHVSLLDAAEGSERTRVTRPSENWVVPPNERFGSAEELKDLIDLLHQQEIGVLVEWKTADTAAATRWVEEYHIDGLSIADILGTDLARELSSELERDHPDVALIGEGASSGFRLDPGFAHDLRSYLAHAPAERKLHHNRLTFRRMYAFQENYIMPLSHREAAPLMRMPGDEWQKFANFRLLLAYMFLQPGKKLLFMGQDFGQWREWNADMSNDWHLTHLRYHQGVQALVRRLNDVYAHEPALHQGDHRAECFEWVDCLDAHGGTISWLRWDANFDDVFLVVFNFTPKVYRNFRIGAPRAGEWREAINTDAKEYGGSGQGNFGAAKAAPFGWHDRPYSLFITVPPLAAVAFKSQERR